jgi:hypothetical protein
MKNPFPGMHPWLEQHWQDIHAKCMVYACDRLNAQLPPGLQARVDERLAIDPEPDRPHTYVPDVAITEPWDRPAKPVVGAHEGGVTVAEPTIVDLGHQILRHIEIVDSRSHVITAIELLSPSNKAGSESVMAWSRKRLDYLRGGINLVEIDLLRGGTWTLPDRSLLKTQPPDRVWHYVRATRAPYSGQHEFYMMPLRQRLPAIRIPLRRADPDVALDLQFLIDQSYERGRYGSVLDYTQPPPPGMPEGEVAWVKQVLATGQMPD